MPRLPVFLVALCLLAAPAFAGALEEGRRAYQQGDYTAVLAHLRPLAEQGNARAQTFLGVMYYRGEGVPKDNISAYMWANLAAAQNSDYAKLGYVRDRIGKNLTPQQRQEAQRLARLCLAQDYKNCSP